MGRPPCTRNGGRSSNGCAPAGLGALPLGVAFAAGWTPCIGPVLAGTTRSPRAVVRSRVPPSWPGTPSASGSRSCSWGLGADRLVRSLGWVKRHYRVIAGVSGALLAVVGVLLMTGLFRQVFGPLARFAPGL